MTDTGADPTPASFDRHDVDVNAPDDARGGHEQASFDRHDTDVNEPDTVREEEQATFDRRGVTVAGPDTVDEEPSFERRDSGN